ncbi:helix-turn-helix domain-containing protein [Priestia megaterium]
MKKITGILLHPVRMRIVRALLQADMTVSELVIKFGNIPQATMYRQIKVLVDSGLVKVTEERPIMKTIEKVYSVVKEHTQITKEEQSSLSPEEQLEFFTTYYTHLLQEVESYLLNENFKNSLSPNKFSYETISLYLSQEERKELTERYHALLKEFTQRQSPSEKTAFTLSTIFIPSVKGKI